MSKQVDCFAPEGDGAPDRSLAAQRRAFLAAYGPEKGYAVETAFTDLMSLKRGFLKLWEAAQFLELKAADLTALVGSAGQTLVCRARLRDARGRVLATATAAKAILACKDLEILETAARQRLLAALGFGREVRLPDAAGDWRDQALMPINAAAPDAIEPVVKPAGGDPVAAASPAVETSIPVMPAGARDGFSAESALAEPAGATTAQAASALALMRQQIKALAALQGIEPPSVTTREQGRAALKQLLTPR